MKKLAILASIALVGLLGCSKADKTGQTSSSKTTPKEKTTQTSSTTGTPAAGPSAMNETDRALTQRVEDALRQNSSRASAAQDVQVQAKDGEVTLSGSVNNEQERANIGSTAQKVAGVSKVNNQIEVASASNR